MIDQDKTNTKVVQVVETQEGDVLEGNPEKYLYLQVYNVTGEQRDYYYFWYYESKEVFVKHIEGVEARTPHLKTKEVRALQKGFTDARSNFLPWLYSDYLKTHEGTRYQK